MVKKGDLVELKVDSSGYEGISVGRLEGIVVFIPYAVPGDQITARIIRKKKRHFEAVIERIVSPSPQRTEPRCQYFGTCGGCTLQSAEYQAQLEYKKEQVADLLTRLGKLKGIPVRETIPSLKPYYYRNKMEFSFGPNRWLTREEIQSGRKLEKGFALGLHIPKRFDKILDLETCYLQSPLTPEIVNATRRHALAQSWEPYHSIKHHGWARNLVIRNSEKCDQMMVNLVVTDSDESRIEPFVKMLKCKFPEIDTIVVSINSSRSPVARGEEIVYHGEGTIQEELGGLSFIITPTSFFQPNTTQAERLFEVIRQFAEVGPDQTVYDLYCGVGAIGLFLGNRVKKVIGVESHAESVELAEKNAAANGIENCSFIEANATEAFTQNFLSSHGTPDTVILDPPRAGLHPDMCQGLLKAKPKSIVYSSCNPATQARDLEILSSAYSVKEVQPVDMFPQTYHIEAVALLSLKS